MLLKDNMKFTLEKIRNILFAVFILFFCQLAIPSPFQIRLDQHFFFLASGIVLYFFLVDFNTKDKLENNAFLLIFILGSVVALNRPVQYGLDEESHLENAIGISDSFFFKYSDEELRDYDAVFLHDGIRNQEHFKGDDYWYNVTHTESKISGYPIGFDNPSFIPGMLGWNIGRLISKKVYISYYLGRIFHVLAYALLVYFAIKFSKVYKEMIYLLGVLPAALYVSSSYHYDYLYFGASLFLMALLTNILSGDSKITLKNSILFQFIVLQFAFAKFPFILMGSLFSIFPNKYYSTKKNRYISILLFLVNMLVSLVFAGFIQLFQTTAPVGGERPSLSYFLIHPLPIIRTFMNAPSAILDNFISHPLQYVSVQSPFLISITAIIFLVFLIVISMKVNIQLPKFLKYGVFLLFLAITFLLTYAMTGDPRVYTLGNILVGGVQGRYYYLMIATIPLVVGEYLHEKISIRPFTEEENFLLSKSLQYTMSFLVVLTISIALYTQI